MEQHKLSQTRRKFQLEPDCAALLTASHTVV